MGRGRMTLPGKLGPQLDIKDTREPLAELDRRLEAGTQLAGDPTSEAHRLADENAGLNKFLAAVIRLLATKDVIARAECAALGEIIGRPDGQPDGGHAGPLRNGS